jgi:hypothetical protein
MRYNPEAACSARISYDATSTFSTWKKGQLNCTGCDLTFTTEGNPTTVIKEIVDFKMMNCKGRPKQ